MCGTVLVLKRLQMRWREGCSIIVVPGAPRIYTCIHGNLIHRDGEDEARLLVVSKGEVTSQVVVAPVWLPLSPSQERTNAATHQREKSGEPVPKQTRSTILDRLPKVSPIANLVLSPTVG